ncbi:MAG: helix-turn-helix domain-containing protein [bacterium]|nr:helix-turn-helix domain-containing protein [bacterium]
MDFGANIKEFRTKKGMTQKDLANELNVTAQAVSRWENNEVEPSISTINQMAELFNCSIDELFGKVKKQDDQKDDNVVININNENDKKEDNVVQVKTNIAICSCCNKPLYEQAEIKRWKYYNYVRHGRSSYREDASDILCEDCFNERANEEKAKAAQSKQIYENGFVKRRIKAIVVMSLIMAVAIFFAVLFAIGLTKNQVPTVLVFLLTGLLFSMLVGSAILGGTFLGDLWLTISSWGFVRFPGIIFTADADGIKFLIVMKVLFFFLGIGFVLLAEAIATTICMVVGPFVFPVALYRNIKKIDPDKSGKTMSDTLLELNNVE